MILVLALMACGFVADLASGEVTRDQVERLCEIAGEVEKRAPAGGGRRLVAIGDRLAQEQMDALEQAWRAIQKAPPKMRKKLYDEMLEGAGMEGFDCPPLERALTR